MYTETIILNCSYTTSYLYSERQTIRDYTDNLTLHKQARLTEKLGE